MITVEDVPEFGYRWFDTVGRGGSAEDQAAFFPHEHVSPRASGFGANHIVRTLGTTLRSAFRLGTRARCD
jgi:hypothetical protein